MILLYKYFRFAQLLGVRLCLIKQACQSPLSLNQHFLAVGWELPFAMKNCWHAPRTLMRTMVISKRNRHHQNHSKQPGKHRKQDKICLSGAYMRCCYCVKSELFCPRCLNEQLFVANNSQPRDAACDSWAKGCYDWFCRCRGFSFFWPPKEHKRKTWRKIQMNN